MLPRLVFATWVLLLGQCSPNPLNTVKAAHHAFLFDQCEILTLLHINRLLGRPVWRLLGADWSFDEMQFLLYADVKYITVMLRKRPNIRGKLRVLLKDADSIEAADAASALNAAVLHWAQKMRPIDALDINNNAAVPHRFKKRFRKYKAFVISSLIKSLPDMTLPRRKGDDGCPICLTGIQDDEENALTLETVAVLPCGHSLCVPCLERLVLTRLACPQCSSALIAAFVRPDDSMAVFASLAVDVARIFRIIHTISLSLRMIVVGFAMAAGQQVSQNVLFELVLAMVVFVLSWACPNKQSLNLCLALPFIHMVRSLFMIVFLAQ